jgi:dolichol-phosphate mannosyltransferase
MAQAEVVMPSTYVVLPTYNERENLRDLASALFSLEVPGLKLLVIDDASPDGTGEIADQLATENPARVEVIHREGKLGLGTAYCLGFATALQRGADSVIQMDADFSHPAAVIPDMLQTLGSSDVAIGSRYVQGGGLDPAWPICRKILSWGANQYIRRILGLQISDITTGFVAYRSSALAAIDVNRIGSSGFIFQAEVKSALHQAKLRMTEVPFIFMNRRAGKSKIGPAIMFEALWKVWQIRLRQFMASKKPARATVHAHR